MCNDYANGKLSTGMGFKANFDAACVSFVDAGRRIAGQLYSRPRFAIRV